MKIIVDKPLINDVFQYDVILYGMGINNSMDNGFSKEIAVNFPIVKENELTSPYGDRRKYGTCIITEIENLIFVGCYFYRGGFSQKIDQVDIESLKKCLLFVKEKYRGKNIASPLLGTSLFDGKHDKTEIFSIFNEIFDNTENFYLYNYEQRDYKLHYYHTGSAIKRLYYEEHLPYDEYIILKSKNEWERLNGIFKPMPDDYVYISHKDKNKQRIRVIKNDCKT